MGTAVLMHDDGLIGQEGESFAVGSEVATAKTGTLCWKWRGFIAEVLSVTEHGSEYTMRNEEATRLGPGNERPVVSALSWCTSRLERKESLCGIFADRGCWVHGQGERIECTERGRGGSGSQSRSDLDRLAGATTSTLHDDHGTGASTEKTRSKMRAYSEGSAGGGVEGSRGGQRCKAQTGFGVELGFVEEQVEGVLA
jgi:hypothetical protein